MDFAETKFNGLPTALRRGALKSIHKGRHHVLSLLYFCCNYFLIFELVRETSAEAIFRGLKGIYPAALHRGVEIAVYLNFKNSRQEAVLRK